MKQLASIHLLFYQRRTYFYMGVLGWWSHMLLSYCLFILSRLGAAQNLAFRLRCNWFASMLAVFIVGLQRFALLGSVHRLVFRGWKAATLVFPLWRVFLCVKVIHRYRFYQRERWTRFYQVCAVQWTICVWTFYNDNNYWNDINMNNLFYNVLYHSWIFWITIIASSISVYISIN